MDHCHSFDFITEAHGTGADGRPDRLERPVLRLHPFQHRRTHRHRAFGAGGFHHLPDLGQVRAAQHVLDRPDRGRAHGQRLQPEGGKDQRLDRAARVLATEADRGVGRLAAGDDLFDQVQLAEVIRVCRVSPSLSAAGRSLFAASRAKRTSTNDADRLKKYLGKFGLTWDAVKERS